MACSLWVLAIPAAVYAFLGWVVFLLLTRPAAFVERFMQRPYRRWGLSVSVDDPAKLRRQATRLGWIFLVFIAAHATLVFSALCGAWKRP